MSLKKSPGNIEATCRHLPPEFSDVLQAPVQPSDFEESSLGQGPLQVCGVFAFGHGAIVFAGSFGVAIEPLEEPCLADGVCFG